MSRVSHAREWTLVQASRDIRAGRLSPVALMERCLSRIATHDADLHAMVCFSPEQAMREARAAEAALRAGQWFGPLHGIPLGIKDVIDVAGMPTVAQSRVRNDWTGRVASADAVSVARLRAAGAIVIGKLTTHEFAFGSPSRSAASWLDGDPADPVATARGQRPGNAASNMPGPAARNPWDPARFAGGSSSGAAVGVASGMMLGALGTDTAGSVRSPAALCGVTGFKPSRARIDRDGCIPLASSLDAVGMIAPTVADCALLYAALAQDAAMTDIVPTFYAPAAHGVRALSGVRIGVVRHFMRDGIPVSAECAAAIEQVATECAAAGARVETAVLPPLAAWQAVGMTTLLTEAYALHAPFLRDTPAHYGDSVAEALAIGAFLRPEDGQRAQDLRCALVAKADALMTDYDVLLAPIQAGEAPLSAGVRQWGFMERPSYGLPFNVADLPALSLCCGFGENGLPLSLQWVGRRGAEAKVLLAAHAYQCLTAWHRRCP